MRFHFGPGAHTALDAFESDREYERWEREEDERIALEIEAAEWVETRPDLTGEGML